TKPTIPDRWPEKIIKPRSQHPHIKPIGLISALIEAITSPGDLVVDPAAGSFVVMHAARRHTKSGRFIPKNVRLTPGILRLSKRRQRIPMVGDPSTDERKIYEMHMAQKRGHEMKFPQQRDLPPDSPGE